MYLPAFPAIQKGLQVGQGDVQRTLAAYLVGLACSQVFYGPLADRYGRKLPLMIGLLIYIAGSLGCAVAPDTGWLMVWRFVQAIGAAAGIVIPRAVIRDHYDTQQAARALSLLLLIMGAAPIIAPLVGAQLLIVGSWRALFWLMALLAASLLFMVFTRMQESLAPQRVQALSVANILGTYGALLGHRRFMAHCLSGGFGQAGMFTYIIGSPHVFMEVFGIPSHYYGLYFGANAIALIGGSQVSARLLRTHHPARLQRGALHCLLAAGLVTFILAISGIITLWLLMGCLMGYMASQGFVNPNSAALALAEQGRRLGAASALMGTLQFTTGALAGFLVSIWQTNNALPMATTLAGCALLAWLFGRAARLKT
jgi:DHA1 family bicyclomycin/chloramphenicol resistance-like MFS transporter